MGVVVTGQVDSVRHLLNYGADLELRDGEVSSVSPPVFLTD